MKAEFAVSAPFVRIGGAIAFKPSEDDPALTRRRLTNGGWGVYANRDLLVHVGDEIDIAVIRTGLHLHGAEDYKASFYIRKVILEAGEPNFSIRSYGDSRADPRPYDKLINAEVAFGGENATSQLEAVALDKWATLKMMADIIAPPE
jgi:hypothetical protein